MRTLKFAITFFMLAIVSAVFGFSDGIHDATLTIVAKISFFIFLVAFVLTLLFGTTLFEE